MAGSASNSTELPAVATTNGSPGSDSGRLDDVELVVVGSAVNALEPAGAVLEAASDSPPIGAGSGAGRATGSPLPVPQAAADNVAIRRARRRRRVAVTLG